MSDVIIPGCFAALGMQAGAGVPGLLSATSCGRFELFQTPGLWGHDPADNAYWLPQRAGASPVLPAASRRLLDAIEEIVAGAERLVDIAGLEQFATGGFTTALHRGLTRAAARRAPLMVRILYGRHRFTKNTPADFDDFLRGITAGLPADCGLRVHACRMETSNHQSLPSWNHAKIVAADGRDALVGGHNLWADDYLGFAPVHDLSARIDGPAAREAHAFLDTLWDWAARERATASGIGTLHLRGWDRGQVADCEPPAAVALPTVAPGPMPVLAVGRLGTGVLADPRLANVGAAVAALAFRQARSSIRISQMDFGFHWDGVNHWAKDVVAALADVLTAPDRSVDVRLVLSEPGAKTAAGGPYSFGTTLADIAAEMRRAIGDRRLTGRMSLAPLRLSATGDRWVHDGTELKIINHAKFWMVDDLAFHVGSDNLYPHNLQEFGYVVESPALAREAIASYWDPLWTFSSRAATDVGS